MNVCAYRPRTCFIGFWCSVCCWKLPHAVVCRTLSRGKCRNSCDHGCADWESRRRDCEMRGVIRFLLGKLSREIVLWHDNARPYTARKTQAFLREKSHWDIFEHPPYSPDLAPSDFFLFQKWRSTLLVNASQMMTWKMLWWPNYPGDHTVWRTYKLHKLVWRWLLLGFTTLLNISGDQRRFRHRAWKVR